MAGPYRELFPTSRLECNRSAKCARRFRELEMIKTPAHVAAGIAVLQAPGENRIQGCSRNHAELAEF